MSKILQPPVHYGSNGMAECGAMDHKVPPELLTTVPAIVTCPTCRGYLPIVAPREATVIKPETRAWLCIKRDTGQQYPLHATKRSLALCDNRFVSQAHVELIERGSEARQCADALKALLGECQHIPVGVCAPCCRDLITRWNGSVVDSKEVNPRGGR